MMSWIKFLLPTTVKRVAAKAGLEAPISPHWLRHAHASHAIDRDATLPEVQATLGHGNIATTSGYLHARPESSSGLKLDPGVFLRCRRILFVGCARNGFRNRLAVVDKPIGWKFQAAADPLRSKREVDRTA